MDTIFNQSQLQKYSIHARMRVAFIQENLFMGQVALVTSRRFFVKFGPLFKTYNKTTFKFSKDKQYQFFLFNDILLYADQDGATFKVKHVVDLSKIKVFPHDDPDNLHFKLEGGNKTLVLKAPDLEAKENWMSTITVFADLASQTPSNVQDYEENILKDPKTKYVREVGNGWFKVATVVGMVFYFQEKTGMTSLCPPSVVPSSTTTEGTPELLPAELLGRKCRYDGCRRFALKFSGRGITCVEHTTIPEEDLKDGDLDMNASMLVRSISKLPGQSSAQVLLKRGKSLDEGRLSGDYPTRESEPPPPPPLEDDFNPQTNLYNSTYNTNLDDEEQEQTQVSKPVLIPRGPPMPIMTRSLPRGSGLMGLPMGSVRRMPPPPVEDSGEMSNKARMILSATPIGRTPPAPQAGASPPPAPVAPPPPAVKPPAPAVPQKRKSSAPELSAPPVAQRDPSNKPPPPPLKNINEALRDQLLGKARGRLLPAVGPPVRIAPPVAASPVVDDEKPSEEVDDGASMTSPKLPPSRPEKKEQAGKAPPPLKPKMSLSSTLTPADAKLKPKPTPAPAPKAVQVAAPLPRVMLKPKPGEVKPMVAVVQMEEEQPAEDEEYPEEEDGDDMKQLYDASTGEPTMWFRILDKDQNRYYFWNDDTEQSLWEIPQGLTMGE
eukprot:TRINITY_DN16948_c1_g3_i1.p1 TRINITY_DN16948_c1_g3~~TRINITY_DN16948_c1_g3_i1.p1  ORF type:complete len:722 (-),score=203.71 TRINITY_DN16948_c1_g3_i1:66-2048(-)